jgi:Putative DNA-binding domain
MLPSELVNKPLHSWTLEDLNLIVARQSEESQFLEFKAQLPHGNDAKGWASGQKLHRSEKDGIAKEIVALANAYGGHVIVGIEESNDNPKRAASLAPPIPRLADCVESLRASLGDLIDPPINGLTFQPISKGSGDDAGYVVVKVPQSIHAPHGFGRPPEAFVRRADKSEPMTMRDMQNVFWEARTRRERIDGELASFSKRFQEIEMTDDVITFGVCAVSESPTQFLNIIEYLRSRAAQQPPKLFDTRPLYSAAEPPSLARGWVPTSRGAANQFGKDYKDPPTVGDWVIDEGGTVSLIARAKGQLLSFETSESAKSDYSTSPEHFVGAIKQFLDLLRLLAFGCSPKSSCWIIRCGFKTKASRFFISTPRIFSEYKKIDFEGGVFLHPILFDFSRIENSVNHLDRKIWESFGIEITDDRLFLEEKFREQWVWN